MKLVPTCHAQFYTCNDQILPSVTLYLFHENLNSKKFGFHKYTFGVCKSLPLQQVCTNSQTISQGSLFPVRKSSTLPAGRSRVEKLQFQPLEELY